jgi:iron complex outermembrane recepter protein
MLSRFGKFRKSAAGLMAAVSATALLAMPAMAQQQPPDDDSRIDVVIVTAQQREENLQDVPLSAATLPDDMIEAIFSGGEDVLALSARVPGLYAESSNGRVAPRFYIRGLGNTDFDLAASQPVSIIMDDVVMENVVLKSTPVFDLDRVEVYRGPQGTLFGRNTTAGIVRFTSMRPTDEFDARASASIGTYNSITFDGGMGGKIAEGVSARISGLYQHRDDWIDNTVTPGENDIGGYDDLAGRLQFLFEPVDDLSILLNVHGRDLDGSSAIFRANIIGPGNNRLNGNYDRDSVSYNGGGGNNQFYEEYGVSATVNWDIGGLEFTSISAMETANGTSRGDIDGGVPGVGPGFIPFDSDTKDILDDLEQYTQEFRLTNGAGEKLTWQAGAYFFQSGFEVGTAFGAGPAVAIAEHENSAWALFAQASYELSDPLTLTAGLRYTDDEKTVTVDANGAFNREVEDHHISWEAAGMYNFTDSLGAYARVAYGFRGPSIQARDLAFGGAPSVAQSEKVLSYEAGFKSTFGDILRLNGSVFAYNVEDMQLTAVGGGGNLIQLINAEEGEAWGAELDAEFAPLDNLVFTGGVAYVRTKIDDPDLAVGVCAQCTVRDPSNANGFALVNGNPFPNAPRVTADATVRYSQPAGDDGEVFVFADVAYQGDTNIFLYESREFWTENQYEIGFKIGYAPTDGSWEAAIFARNVSDEDNIKGAIDFNNNTGFVNDPRIVGISLKINN